MKVVDAGLGGADLKADVGHVVIEAPYVIRKRRAVSHCASGPLLSSRLWQRRTRQPAAPPAFPHTTRLAFPPCLSGQLSTPAQVSVCFVVPGATPDSEDSLAPVGAWRGHLPLSVPNLCQAVAVAIPSSPVKSSFGHHRARPTYLHVIFSPSNRVPRDGGISPMTTIEQPLGQFHS